MMPNVRDVPPETCPHVDKQGRSTWAFRGVRSERIDPVVGFFYRTPIKHVEVCSLCGARREKEGG